MTTPRRLAGEFLGTALLLAVVIGSGIMGERLAPRRSIHRGGAAQGLSEFVATFGLLGTIFGCLRFRPDFAPSAVGLYITSAYWFAASTSFANPAVTVARAMSDSFAGMAPASVPLFIFGQFAALALAVPLFGWLFRQERAP